MIRFRKNIYFLIILYIITLTGCNNQANNLSPSSNLTEKNIETLMIDKKNLEKQITELKLEIEQYDQTYHELETGYFKFKDGNATLALEVEELRKDNESLKRNLDNIHANYVTEYDFLLLQELLKDRNSIIKKMKQATNIFDTLVIPQNIIVGEDYANLNVIRAECDGPPELRYDIEFQGEFIIEGVLRFSEIEYQGFFFETNQLQKIPYVHSRLYDDNVYSFYITNSEKLSAYKDGDTITARFSNYRLFYMSGKPAVDSALLLKLIN